MNYESLKEKYLEKLKKVEDTLKGIEKYKKFDIFDQEELKNLNKINEKNSFYLDKLVKGEIEVAIVGMENTGKSTFANALIKIKEAFPTGSVRTTFTSTRLKYGSEDKAVVEFFSHNEFNSMFREMLQKVDYPKYDAVKFEDLNKASYQSYFENLKVTNEAIYKAYNSTVNKDIIAILEGKKEIHSHLGKEKRYFSKEDIANEELKKFITDKYIARTVKNVELELSEFEDTKELVIYDVPGFNSTTDKHKLETKKSLDRADAIILIKNVIENSEITSEEQAMLNSYDEENGLALSDKLFVFGTKVDRANSKDEALRNIKQIKIDLKSNLNVEENRVFIGSPYAYMQRLGFETGDEAVSTLTKWEMSEYIDSIEDMKEAIKEFYRNEAFNNIQKQINKNIESLKSILSTIVYEHEDNKKLELINIHDNGMLLEFKRNVNIRIDDKLNDLNSALKKDIYEEKYFSERLKEKIETISEEVTIEKLDKLNSSVSDIRNEFATNKVNTKFREKLLPEIRDKFEGLIVSLANQKYDEYFERTISILLEVMEVSTDNIHYVEIKEKLQKHVEELTQTISYKETSYVYLVQRFSRDLLSVVIGAEIGSSTRKERFKEAKKEFISLAMYYQEDEGIKDIYDYTLIQKVLNIYKEEKNDDAIIEALRESFSDLFKYESFMTVVSLIVGQNIPLSIAITTIDKIKGKFPKISESNLPIVIKQITAELAKSNDDESAQKDLETDEKLDILFKKVKVSDTKEELLDELNSDIACLKDILKTAVTEATGLELPFVTSLVDQNKKIIESDEAIDKFIVENFSKIKYRELGTNQERRVNLEEQKRVIGDIQELMTNI